jgi:Trk K+ transport system NAD-binding subunit
MSKDKRDAPKPENVLIIVDNTEKVPEELSERVYTTRFVGSGVERDR